MDTDKTPTQERISALEARIDTMEANIVAAVIEAIVSQFKVSEKSMLDAIRHDRWQFMRYLQNATKKFWGDWSGDGN